MHTSLLIAYTPQITPLLHLHSHAHSSHSWHENSLKFHQKSSWHHVISAQSVTLTRHLHHIPFKQKKKNQWVTFPNKFPVTPTRHTNHFASSPTLPCTFLTFMVQKLCEISPKIFLASRHSNTRLGSNLKNSSIILVGIILTCERQIRSSQQLQSPESYLPEFDHRPPLALRVRFFFGPQEFLARPIPAHTHHGSSGFWRHEKSPREWRKSVVKLKKLVSAFSSSQSSLTRVWPEFFWHTLLRSNLQTRNLFSKPTKPTCRLERKTFSNLCTD
jgi:hypothetical protein